MQVTTSKYDNFVNSINSEQTKEQYVYSLAQFLKRYQIDLDSFLRLSQQEISDYIINYLVNKRVSRQYKIVILILRTRLFYDVQQIKIYSRS